MFPSPLQEDTFASADPNEMRTNSANLTLIGLQSRLYNENGLTEVGRQQSWLFYLTEITLRRTRNTILNTLYKQKEFPGAGMSIPNILKIIASHEAQLSDWLVTLPPFSGFELMSIKVQQDSGPIAI
jgi:hypothetical protein